MDLNEIQKLLSQLSNPNRLFGGVYGAGGSGPSILRDPLGGGSQQSPISGSLGAPQGLAAGPQALPQQTNSSSGLLQQLFGSINQNAQASGQAPNKF